MAYIKQEFNEDSEFNPVNAREEEAPIETPEEAFERERKKITITKKGIFAGENYETIYEFIQREELEERFENIDTALLKKVLLYDADITADSADNTGYSRSQANTKYNEKADVSAVYLKADTMSKNEIVTELSQKADSSTTYSKNDTDRAYLKIKDLPFAKNPKVQNPVITDLNAATQNPFGQDAFLFTQEDYDALSEDEKLNNKLYIIVDGTTEEILGSSKPSLSENQVKIVKAGTTLRIDFTMYPQTTLSGDVLTASFQSDPNKGNLGSLKVYDDYALYTAPTITESGFVTLRFRGIRNNMQSQGLDVVIDIYVDSTSNKQISFDGNGCSKETERIMPATQAVKVDNDWPYILPECKYQPVAGSNLEFSNWYIPYKDGSSKTGNPGDTIIFNSGEPVTIYAVWRQKVSNTMQIFYHANNGTEEETIIDSHNINSNKAYTVRGSNYTPPEGMKFICWSYDPNGEGEVCVAGESLVFHYAGATHFYAIWRAAGDMELFKKPETPELKNPNAIKLELVEGESAEYEFTQVPSTNALYVSKVTDLKNNRYEIIGNTKVKLFAEYGSVDLTIFVYQRTRQGIDSDNAYFKVKIIESSPAKLVLATQELKTLINEELLLEFSNFDSKNTLQLNTNAPEQVSIVGDKVRIFGYSVADLNFQVIQVKTARNGTILKSDPLTIQAQIVESL